MTQLYGGIEAGGTKWVCTVAAGPHDIIAEERFPTTTPAETLGRAVDFFQRHGPERLTAIGVGSFGPVDLERSSPSYGYITGTPKAGWANTDVVGTLTRALGRPVAFDTDVNVALVGEQRWGAAQGCDVAVYLTVGTGVGGGLSVGGRLVHGLIHPEMGHIAVRRDPVRDPFSGTCPYHGDCLEGLASGPAIAARYGVPAQTLLPEHPAWELVAEYLGQACATLLLIASAQRIVIGGGVMEQPQIWPLLHRAVLRRLNGYLQHPQVEQHIAQLIVPPALGNQAGMLGAIALAMEVQG
jgi:fructokinase